MEIKNITVIASDYPAKGSQNLVFVQQLVHALIEQGVHINVIAPQSVVHNIVRKQNFLPIYSKGKTEQGIEYNVYRPYTLSSGNHKLFNKLLFWYNEFVMCRMVSKIKSDVLYSHFWSSAQLVYKYALKNKIPLFVACGEGDNALENMVESKSEEELLLLSSAVTGVVSVSSENKRKCIEFGLAKDNNIEVFPNGVNTSIFHKMDVHVFKKQLGIKEGDFVIGFVGGFVPRKGPDRIAKAIVKLQDPSIKVMFIGKPFSGYPYEFDCPGIIYKGPLEHKLLPKYVNCVDVLVMPTQKEGCCNAIVEALAMGIPVISSNGAFNDDILDENNSIRLDPNDVDAIADAIKALKDDTSRRKRMSEYSLSRHEEYSISRRAKRIIEFMTMKIRNYDKK